MKAYEQGVFMHSIVDYSSASDGIAAVSPRTLSTVTSSSTDAPQRLQPSTRPMPGVADGDAALSIQGLLDVRDQRLAMTTYPNVFYPGDMDRPQHRRHVPQTGYGGQVRQLDILRQRRPDRKLRNITAAPTGVRASIWVSPRPRLKRNPHRCRRGQIHQASVGSRRYRHQQPQPGMARQHERSRKRDMGVSSPSGKSAAYAAASPSWTTNIRYWDLVRWHQLDKLDTTCYQNPDIVLGANIANAPACTTMW